MDNECEAFEKVGMVGTEIVDQILYGYTSLEGDNEDLFQAIAREVAQRFGTEVQDFPLCYFSILVGAAWQDAALKIVALHKSMQGDT